ncbi:hypothetical protein [Streptomyces sp. NBC_01304]|uniref:hypothetical protein n=1 Tax=Streptomyces sp. NBC_01304 TaxID=2903818 RepID=UPI002E138BE2|nr:hypothetical protein OG430_20365 [Streptomyces sp. NBC_01304]
MTAIATAPVAALRLVRSAAGRRALQVALFLGGLLALGLLCSGQAHAGESGPEVPDIAGEVQPLETTPADLESTTAEPVRGATEAVTEPVVEGLKPVRTSVRSTTAAVTEGATRTLGDLSEDAERAAAALPEPRLPKAPPLPGGDLSAPAQDPAAPAPASAPRERAGPDRDVTAKPPVKHQVAGSNSAHSAGDWRTTTSAGQSGQDGHAATRAARQGNAPSPSPAPQPPYGLAAQSATDGGSQRHGDAHAVALSGAGGFRLVPGGHAPATYHPVRDRHRDILEFPG